MRELRDKPLSKFAVKIRDCLNKSDEFDGTLRLARTSPTDTVAYGIQEDGFEYTITVIKMPRPRLEKADAKSELVVAENASE